MDYNKHFKRVLFSQKQIEDKCAELAQWVNETYKGSEDLILIGLLKGSIPFMAELIKGVTVVHDMDFMTISSYHGGTNSSGTPKIVMDLESNVEGKDVLIVEDIVDTGRTLSIIKDMINSRGPKSIKVLTLLDKKEGRVVDFTVEKFGFEVENVFLAGFGLDVNGKLRNVPYIGEFNVDYLDKY